MKSTMLFRVVALSSVLALLSSSLALAQAAAAAADTCDADVVEVQLPYFGPADVVDECIADKAIPTGHCPTPFPTFKASEELAPRCDVAVVGAGTGGLYAAMRLIESQKVNGSGVCIFEATDRVGGRIYSLRGMGPDKDLTVDAGGYRTWPRFTPVTHELITKTLGLPMDCYEPETPCQKYNIVDKDGKKDGFASMPEKLMERVMKHGARWFPNAELVAVNKTGASSAAPSRLAFKNGVTSVATHVILNVPQRPLLKIVRNSNLPPGAVDASLYNAIHAVQTEIVTKLYMYYSDAWWLKLNLTVGDINQDGDTQNMLLAGRYHDGHVNCDNATGKCHGFLMTVYAHDYAGDKAQYFRRFQSDRGEPVTIISRAKSVEHVSFLNHAHHRLKEYHKSGMDYSTKQMYMGHLATYKIEEIIENAPAPDFAVLATWNIGTYGAGGGWHGWTNLDQVTKAKQPLNAHGIHVINEAYSNVQGWAEGSLQLADVVLKDHFGVDHPWDFAVNDTTQRVAQTSATANCAASDAAGGGAPPASGSAAPSEDDHLCFVAGTLVKMANGSNVPIENVQEGDVVRTGGAGRGIVTKRLVHPLPRAELFMATTTTTSTEEWGLKTTTALKLDDDEDDEEEEEKETDVVEVAVVHGVAGTPSHPVLDVATGGWIEMREHPAARVELRPRARVKNWYNLEIDGDLAAAGATGNSLHAYVLVGDDDDAASPSSELVASGLGDNEELNRRYPRQHAWREVVARDLVSPPATPTRTYSSSSASERRVHGGSAYITAAPFQHVGGASKATTV